MRCLTLHQPWAAAVALGYKKNETRHFYRRPGGWLAIHSAKKWDRKLEAAAQRLAAWADKPIDYFMDMRTVANRRGFVVCVARFVDCVEMTQELIDATPDAEKAFGGWEVGRFAWQLEDVHPLSDPLPLKGRQSIWTLSASVEAEVRQRAGIGVAA